MLDGFLVAVAQETILQSLDACVWWVYAHTHIIYVCMYVCMHVCICVHLHVYTHAGSYLQDSVDVVAPDIHVFLLDHRHGPQA